MHLCSMGRSGIEGMLTKAVYIDCFIMLVLLVELMRTYNKCGVRCGICSIIYELVRAVLYNGGYITERVRVL